MSLNSLPLLLFASLNLCFYQAALEKFLEEAFVHTLVYYFDYLFISFLLFGSADVVLVFSGSLN